MLNLNYNLNIDEMATATLDFLENRPILKFSLFNMKMICCMTIGIYLITVYHGNISWLNSSITIGAIAWLFFRRKLNYFILHKSLTRKKVHEYVNNIEIYKHKIFTKINNSVTELGWSKISFVYQSKNGYMIPLPGISNSGKFIWLPLRSFTNTHEENTFLDIVKNYKLKIKLIKP